VNISRKFGKDLKSIYDKYLSNLLLSDEKFLGPTISSIKNFKETIGISDEDASLVHIAVGKRINHTRSESENQNEVVDAGRTFNKIIYITTQVFGERKSYYLVDWKRHFNLTNAQIFIAKRDFASKIFKTTLLSRIDDPLPGETFFSSARQEMGKILLTKEVAGKITNDTMEKISAVKISQAGEEIKKTSILKKQTVRCENVKNSLPEVSEWILSFLRRIRVLSNIHGLFPGLHEPNFVEKNISGSNSLTYKTEIYRFILETCSKEGKMGTRCHDNVREISSYLNFSSKTGQKILLEFKRELYCSGLCNLFFSGNLATHPDNSSLLNNLCYCLDLPARAALVVNAVILGKRYEQLLAKQNLTVSDVNNLEKMKYCLCIDKKTFHTIKRNICGRIYRKFVRNTMKKGLITTHLKNKKTLIQRKSKLLLDDNLAQSIFQTEAKKMLIETLESTRDYIKSAQNTLEIILFSTTVLRPLSQSLFMLRGKKILTTVSNMPNDEFMQRYCCNLPYLEKIKLDLMDDLSLQDRIKIYNNFHWYCITVKPSHYLNTQTNTHKLQSEKVKFTHLKILGHLLALTEKDVTQIHKKIMKNVFKKEVEKVYSDDATNNNKKIIHNIYQKLGLQNSEMTRITTIVKNRKLSEKIQQRMAEAEIIYDDFNLILKNGLNTKKRLFDKNSVHVYGKNLDKALRSSSKEYNKEMYLATYPNCLSLSKKKIDSLIKHVAIKKWNITLVELVSFFRQHMTADLTNAFWNLVSQHRAFVSQIGLDMMDEVLDAYIIYFHIKNKHLHVTNGKSTHEVAQCIGFTNTEAEIIGRIPMRKSIKTKNPYEVESLNIFRPEVDHDSKHYSSTNQTNE
jgi:hypothetical protein